MGLQTYSYIFLNGIFEIEIEIKTKRQIRSMFVQCTARNEHVAIDVN